MDEGNEDPGAPKKLLSPWLVYALWGGAILCGAAAGLVIGREEAPPGDVTHDALGVPLPPLSEAAVVKPSTSKSPLGMTCFESRLDRKAVAEYLRESLRSRGWVEDPDFAQVLAQKSGQVILSFRRGDERLICGLKIKDDGGTRVTNLSWRRNEKREGLH